MHGVRAVGVENIIDLIYHLFAIATEVALGDQLPPAEDTLRKHVDWANYQTGIQLRSLEAKPDVPQPSSHGWSLITNVETGKLCLAIAWMSQQPAPEQLLILVHCKCQTGCESGRCSCILGGWKCTDARSCVGCEN